MWATVLVMAAAVILEPVRISLAVLMLNRPRPALQLLGFLCGGFTMGVGAGMVVLFVLRDSPLAAGRFSVPKVQIAVGLIALLIAGALVAKSLRRTPRATREGTGDDQPGTVASEPKPSHRMKRYSASARRILRGDSLWVAGVSGLATALPSANYLGAMAVILAYGAAPWVQVQALVAFNVVAFTLVEIPLISYLIAPRRTQAAMISIHTWLRARPRRDVAVIVAAGGCVVLALGLIRL